MNILVGPLCRFTDGSPFLCAHVPTLRDVRLFRLKTLDDDFPKLLDALLLGFFDPRRTGIGSVMGAPMVRLVYFVDGSYQVLI